MAVGGCSPGREMRRGKKDGIDEAFLAEGRKGARVRWAEKRATVCGYVL